MKASRRNCRIRRSDSSWRQRAVGVGLEVPWASATDLGGTGYQVVQRGNSPDGKDATGGWPMSAGTPARLPCPPVRHLPFPCPKFPCQTRLCPPKTAIRAGSQIIRFLLRPPPGSGSKFPRSTPASRAATRDRSRSFGCGAAAYSGPAPATRPEILSAPVPMLPLRPGRPRSAGVAAPPRCVHHISVVQGIWLA